MKNIPINHDIGETVFTMDNNAVVETEVQHVRIDVSLQTAGIVALAAIEPESKVTINYTLKGFGQSKKINQSDIFATKAELLASL